MENTESTYQLPRRARRIFLSLCHVMIVPPPDLVVRDSDEEFLSRLTTIFREMQPFFRKLFFLGLYVFEYCPWLFGRGVVRFLRMSDDKKSRYIHFWENTNSATLRNFFKGVRASLMISYFSHPDFWEYIGYRPAEHVAEKIRVREALLAQDDFAEKETG